MIHIRKVATVDEYEACEDLQIKVWQFEDREVIPRNELITIQREGGVVLGAFDGKKLIGFVFGLPGVREKKLIHCSRMLAVLPEYRNKNIGFRLKLAQRNFALKQGVKIISWTFDPLQAKNAYFNIEKLGVVSNTYLVNLYGFSSSILNKGLPTDRFLVDWFIESKRVKNFIHNKRPRINISKILSLNDVKFNRKNLPVSTDVRNCDSEEVLIKIPMDIDSLKRRDLKLALDWRYKLRSCFLDLFKRGYVVHRFGFDDNSNPCYVAKRYQNLKL